MTVPLSSPALRPFAHGVLVGPHAGDFASLMVLQRALMRLGAAWGPPEGGAPLGVSFARGARIGKWSTLSEDDVLRLDGVILAEQSGIHAYRVGAVRLRLCDERELVRLCGILPEPHQRLGASAPVATVKIAPSAEASAELREVQGRARTVAAGLQALGLGDAAEAVEALGGMAGTLSGGGIQIGIGGAPAPARRRSR